MNFAKFEQKSDKIRSNPKQFFADSQKLMKKLGIRYATPKKRNSGNDEDAA